MAYHYRAGSFNMTYPSSIEVKSRSERPSALENTMMGQVSSMISARRHRSEYFRSDLFADPAWDILLDLTRARLEDRRICVSSLCIAASVPATTAIRWINTLTEEGLLMKLRDPTDGRRVFVTLTASAAASMQRYLALDRASRLPTRGAKAELAVEFPPLVTGQ
jgi:hypothetical protein